MKHISEEGLDSRNLWGAVKSFLFCSRWLFASASSESSYKIICFHSIDLTFGLYCVSPMTRHTIPEYRNTFEQATGIACDTVMVYDEGDYERIAFFHDGVELIQIPDVAELSNFAHHIPPSLHNDQSDINLRYQILAQLQSKTEAFERVLQELIHFREEMQCMLLREGAPPLEIVRDIRGHMEETIWNATPLLLKQLKSAIHGKK